MEKDGKVFAYGAKPQLQHFLRAAAYDDVIPVFYWQTEQLIADRAADSKDLHGSDWVSGARASGTRNNACAVCRRQDKWGLLLPASRAQIRTLQEIRHRKCCRRAWTERYRGSSVYQEGARAPAPATWTALD